MHGFHFNIHLNGRWTYSIQYTCRLFGVIVIGGFSGLIFSCLHEGMLLQWEVINSNLPFKSWIIYRMISIFWIILYIFFTQYNLLWCCCLLPSYLFFLLFFLFFSSPFPLFLQSPKFYFVRQSYQ